MSDWPTFPIRDLTTKVGSGATPRGGESSYKEFGTPLIRSMNVHFDGFRYEGLAYLDDSQAEDLKSAIVQKNDVLLNITGASIGRVTQVPPDLDGARVNQHVCIIRPIEALEPSFLRWYLASPGQQSFINKEQTGATRQGLTKEKIQNFDVPVPSLAEQLRIVSKIEELFSDLDAGIAALKRAKANLKRYRAAVLKAAVEGKLTEQWRAEHPNTEPAAKLLERILGQRRQKWEADRLADFAVAKKIPPKGWRAKYIEPVGVDRNGLHDLPEGWCWTKFDQLLTYLRNGYFQSPSKAEKGVPILRINAVRPMSVDLSERRFLDDIKGIIEDFYVENGDLLFTRYYGSIEFLGVAGMVRSCVEKTLHPDKLIRVKVAHSSSLAEYIEIAANCGSSREHIVGRARTTAGQTGISGPDIREMPIPLPPHDEQNQIITEVAEKLSQIEAAGLSIDRALLRAFRLRQSVLKQAFEGKLVPQDPHDEPATVLLSRVGKNPSPSCC